MMLGNAHQLPEVLVLFWQERLSEPHEIPQKMFFQVRFAMGGVSPAEAIKARKQPPIFIRHAAINRIVSQPPALRIRLTRSGFVDQFTQAPNFDFLYFHPETSPVK